MRRAVVIALAVTTAAAVLTGCGPDNKYLRDGEYAGSTQARQAVKVDVGSSVYLDGQEMRVTADGAWVAADHSSTRMRCHMTANNTEMVCTISRAGRRETVELLKL